MSRRLPPSVSEGLAKRNRAGTTPDANPESMPLMEALIQTPRPLMLPRADGNWMNKLRAAVDLSLSPGFRDARHAYFTWFRDFMEPLRIGDPHGHCP